MDHSENLIGGLVEYCTLSISFRLLISRSDLVRCPLTEEYARRTSARVMFEKSMFTIDEEKIVSKENVENCRFFNNLGS